MAKGYRNTLFTSVKTPRVPLNRFDLSFDRIGTFKMGKLYPIICKEMLPGDRFRVRTDSLVRTMPLSSPAFGRLRMYIHYFFVPNRLVWDNWEDFITGGESGGGQRPGMKEASYAPMNQYAHGSDHREASPYKQ